MGADEKGVVIGNEAVWTRMPLQKNGVLTGMDLLRLALERSSSAEQALEIVIQHLSDYGQGGRCGHEDSRISYHNSYIIADSRGAWVLETAQSKGWSNVATESVFGSCGQDMSYYFASIWRDITST